VEQVTALTHDEAMSLLAYLVASARTCLSDPPDSAPFRLISGALRLAQLWRPRSDPQVSALLEQLIEQIPNEAARRKADPNRFLSFLDECCHAVARQIKTT